jgi:two-component system chemotaxis sensor kinase CheA
MAFDTEAYIELFFQEAEEHIQLMTDALLDLEKTPSNPEPLSALFRAAHTIKSSSAMVGFMHVSEFTHRMEDLIGYLRDNKITIDSAMVDLLFQAFDVLKEMFTQLQDGATEAKRNKTKNRSKELIGSFSNVISGVVVEAEKPQPPSPAPRPKMILLDEETRIRIDELRLAGEHLFEMTIQFYPDAQMISTRAFLILSHLNQLGTVIKTVPDLDNDTEVLEHSIILLVATHKTEEAVKKAADVADVQQVDIRDVTQADQFDLTDKNKEAESTAEQESTIPTIQETMEENVTSFDRREDKTKTQTVRVNIEKLDRLLNLAAEMVIQRGRSHELSQQLVERNGKGSIEEEILDSIVQQGMFLTQLQETIMESRMVPIGMVFSRFRRVVRDLAHARGKAINLQIEGEETELDKKIIDQIGDPLMHMIRNSIDHGVETPEERKRSGKPKEGVLHLNAIHQGNSIVISVRDDGQGIDPEKLRKKAVEKGILSAEEAASLQEKECLHLIFRPGFSTAQEITDISGRGVGMDVVRRTIEQLGGTVDIETELGKGTTFYLKLPLTLAIIQALLVEADSEQYALPISSISETIRILKKDIFSVKGQGQVIRLRDDVVPILNLRNIINANPSNNGDDRLYVAILRHGNNFVGLIVDRMVNEQEVVIKPLGGDISNASFIAGAAILGNGRVILILDAASLIEKTLGLTA